MLSLADFSNALKPPKENPLAFEPVGVLYWQAPEVRAYVPSHDLTACVLISLHSGPYNALKVDVWSLGATVWEMAQARPPFVDEEDNTPHNRWPPLDRPQLYSPQFHDFLRLCSEPPSSRPDPSLLLKV